MLNPYGLKYLLYFLFSSCSDAEKVNKCVDENMAKCSNTLKSQVMTMKKLNMMIIGDMCKFDMKVKTQVEKAREMYSALIEFMTNGKLCLYSFVCVCVFYFCLFVCLMEILSVLTSPSTILQLLRGSLF